MYVGVIFDKQTKMVADYMPEATLMEYTICDDGYKQNGTKWLPDAYIKTYLSEKSGENQYHQRLAVLICGAIGDGAARALEDYGVKIFRNVTGDVESVFEDYKNIKLDEGENTKLPARQNLFEYLRAHRIYDERELDCYRKGLETFGAALTEKDKLWIYDQCYALESRWYMFPFIAEVLDIRLDLKHALKYMSGFLKVFSRVDGRNCDNVKDQSLMVERIKILADNMKEDERQEFLDETFIVVAKNREIMVAEYLMDQGADISYVNKKGLSVEKYETAMEDMTMATYLSYYRMNGKKKGSAVDYFKCKVKNDKDKPLEERMWVTRYDPRFKEEEGVVFGKRALSVCKEILKDYEKTGILKKTTKAEELDAFVEEYNWDDGFEVPHFIAVHPNCSRETKEKMYELVEGSSYYGTKDFEDSDDEQWKAFITELHDMLNG